MLESIQNNKETHVWDDSHHDQGSGVQALCNVPQNLSGMPQIILESTNAIENPNC